MNELLIAYFVFINVTAAAMTAADKHRARIHSRRIPERVLLALAGLGGSVSMLITMYLIHHKTRKPKFRFGVPLIVVAQALLCILIYCMFFSENRPVFA